MRLNPNKTEVLWCAASRRQHQLPVTTITMFPSLLYRTSVTSVVSTVTIPCGYTFSERFRAATPLSPPATLSSSVGTCGHFPDAGSCFGALLPGPLQRCAVWHPTAPNAATSVGPERGGATDLSRQTLRPHFCRVGQSPLAASPGPNRVQDCSVDVQSSPWKRAVVPGTTHLRCPST